MSSDEPAEVSLDEGSPKDKMTERRKRIQEAIFEAAIEEFANKGFEGASTQSIAQRAGLTKPQLHYYIESKEELYKNILLTILEDWNQIFLGATAEDDPAKVLRAYIHNKLEYSIKNPKSSRLFTTEIANGAPQLGEHWEPHKAATQNAVKLIQQWVDDGRILPVDPLLFQMHIWAVTQHYADFDAQVRQMMNLSADEDIDINRIKEDVTNLFLRACGLV